MKKQLIFIDAKVENYQTLTQGTAPAAEPIVLKRVSRVQEPASRQLVIIDAAVAEHHLLAAGVEPGIEVLILHPALDGIAQITQALQNREIQTLHIIAHGESGTLHLGSSTVTASNLHTYTAHLSAWKQALSEAADILIYSCSLAAGLSGREFLEKLQQLTRTNIAAANTPVGNPASGGTWKLISS